MQVVAAALRLASVPKAVMGTTLPGTLCSPPAEGKGAEGGEGAVDDVHNDAKKTSNASEGGVGTSR
jgi:hypothetical protein